MITPATYPLTIYAGATFDRTFTLKNPDGSLVNLSGAMAAMQIRDTVGSSAVLLDLAAAGYITLGGVAGTVRIVIPDDVTAALTWLRGVYDLAITSVGGITDRWLEGPATVKPAVTR